MDMSAPVSMKSVKNFPLNRAQTKYLYPPRRRKAAQIRRREDVLSEKGRRGGIGSKFGKEIGGRGGKVGRSDKEEIGVGAGSDGGGAMGIGVGATGIGAGAIEVDAGAIEIGVGAIEIGAGAGGNGPSISQG